MPTDGSELDFRLIGGGDEIDDLFNFPNKVLHVFLLLFLSEAGRGGIWVMPDIWLGFNLRGHKILRIISNWSPPIDSRAPNELTHFQPRSKFDFGTGRASPFGLSDV